jgi:hypothetical protein
MLQLNFRVSDLVCAKHDAESSNAAMGNAQHHGMAMDVDHEQQAAGEKKSCEIPVTKDCCQGVTSCAMTFGLGVDLSANGAPASHDGASAVRSDAPASLVSSPEPPPPRL